MEKTKGCRVKVQGPVNQVWFVVTEKWLILVASKGIELENVTQWQNAQTSVFTCYALTLEYLGNFMGQQFEWSAAQVGAAYQRKWNRMNKSSVLGTAAGIEGLKFLVTD